MESEYAVLKLIYIVKIFLIASYLHGGGENYEYEEKPFPTSPDQMSTNTFRQRFFHEEMDSRRMRATSMFFFFHFSYLSNNYLDGRILSYKNHTDPPSIYSVSFREVVEFCNGLGN
jgi:hypothetical protein